MAKLSKYLMIKPLTIQKGKETSTDPTGVSSLIRWGSNDPFGVAPGSITILAADGVTAITVTSAFGD